MADQFHLHVPTVRRHLRLAGATARSKQSPLNDAQLAEVEALMDSGVSLRRIGTLLNMSHSTVPRLLQDYERRVTAIDSANEVEMGGHLLQAVGPSNGEARICRSRWDQQGLDARGPRYQSQPTGCGWHPPPSSIAELPPIR